MNAVTALLWKEYRTYRALWLLAILFAVTWQFLLPYASFLTPTSRLNAGTYWNIAVLFVCLYSIGVSSTLFNHEHETRSYDLLQWLPTTTSSLWLGKIGFVVLSVVSLTSVLTCFASMFVWSNFGAIEITPETVLLFFLPPVTVFVGLTCSLLIKRSLLAPFVVVAVMSLTAAIWMMIRGSSIFASFLWSWFGSKSRLWILQLDDWVLLSGTLSAAGCLLSLPLTHIWLRKSISFPIRRAAKTFRSIRDRSNPTTPFLLQVDSLFPKKSVIQRTVWLQFRQMWHIWISLLVMAIAVSSVVANSLFLLFVLPAVLGVSTFVGDYVDDSISFYANRRIRATHVWFARQLVPACLLAVLLVAERSLSLFVWKTEILAGAFLQTFLTFAAAQALAIYIRKPLITVFIATAIIPFFTNWAAFVREFQLPITLCVVFPMAILFVVSFLKTASWFTEAHHRRRLVWINVMLTIGTLVSLYLGIWTHRVYEVPSAIGVIDPRVFEEIPAPNRQKLDLYKEAFELSTATPKRQDAHSPNLGIVGWSQLPLPISKSESEWISQPANAEALSKILAAVEYPFSSLHWEMALRPKIDSRMPRLVKLCIAKARQLRAVGDSEQALQYERAALEICTDRRTWTWNPKPIDNDEHFIVWHLLFAASQATDSTTIEPMQEMLKEHAAARPRSPERKKAVYLYARKRVDDLLPSMHESSWNRRTALFFDYLPGERARALRLCDFGYRRVEWNHFRDKWGYNAFGNAVLTTPVLRRLGIDPSWWGHELNEEAIALRNLYRAGELQFEIQKWRIQNGRFPLGLDEAKISKQGNDLSYSKSLSTRHGSRVAETLLYFDPTGVYRFEMDVTGPSVYDQSRFKRGEPSSWFPLPAMR